MFTSVRYLSRAKLKKLSSTFISSASEDFAVILQWPEVVYELWNLTVLTGRDGRGVLFMDCYHIKSDPFQIFPLLHKHTPPSPLLSPPPPPLFPSASRTLKNQLNSYWWDYFRACCLEWQERLTDCSPWYWMILNFSTLCNFLPPHWHQKMRKRFSLFYKGKTCRKYAVYFVVNVGKFVDKPVDTEGKYNWTEQYLKIMTFWCFTTVGIIKECTKYALFHFVRLSVYHHHKGIAVITLLRKLVRRTPIFKTSIDKAQITGISICLGKLFQLLCAIFYHIF